MNSSLNRLNLEERYVPDFLSISEPVGRLFVIPDIHGCVSTFRSLLTRLNLQKEDYLILLGDYINKGANSLGVLDTIIELLQQRLNVWPLLGNHEKMLMDVHYGFDNSVNLKSLYISTGLVDSEGKIISTYRKFLLNLPYYYKIGSNYFVHAGFDFQKPSPFEDYDSMLWIRNFSVPTTFEGRIFHGHVPTTLPTIEMNVRKLSNNVCLDNGCFSKHKLFMGNLLCLEVKSGLLLIEENCD